MLPLFQFHSTSVTVGIETANEFEGLGKVFHKNHRPITREITILVEGRQFQTTEQTLASHYLLHLFRNRVAGFKSSGLIDIWPRHP